MCERRILILALVTDIHDTAVTYPSCIRCYSKLLVDPTTDRYHCIRCSVSCDKRSVQWRYRLVLSVADGTTLGKVVVFGKTLDGFFGKTATDFSRSLGDLERTGYPASSMLAEALLRTFHGKYFYFGFKLTGSKDLEEKYSLRDVLKPESSLCFSQLDSTSNFEKFHTLAYQMLACSDAVFASVTDHMRLFVKQLRNQNQSKPLQTPKKNQSLRNLNKTESVKNISNKKDNSSTFYSTLSFGEDVDSLRFSFENSESKSYSLQETEIGSRNKRDISLNRESLTDSLKNDGSSSVSLIDMKGKETFLASETTVDDLPRYLTFDTVNEDGESCFPSVAIWSKSCSILQSRIKNSLKNESFVPFHHEKFQSEISVAQRLNFDDIIDSNASITSKKIDDALKRRENFTSQKSAINKTSHTRSAFGLIDLTDQNHYKHKLRNKMRNTEDVDLSKSTVEINLDNEEGMIENQFKPCGDVSVKRLPDDKMIDELRMPESEDLNAFFESQFEGIDFTQYSDSEEQSGKLHNEDAGITDNDMNSGGANIENEINQGNTTGKQSSLVNNMDKVTLKLVKSTESTALEEYKDFLDSFEECQVEAKQDIVNVSAENQHVSLQNVTEQGEWNEPDKGVDDREDLNKHEMKNTSKRIRVEKVRRDENDNDSLGINENIINDFETDLNEEKERFENGLNNDKQEDSPFSPLFCNSINFGKGVNTKKTLSTIMVGNFLLNIDNLDNNVEAGKGEVEVNELVEKDNLTDDKSDDYYNSSQESSDLDQFFADISNERNDYEVGNREVKVEENSNARSKQMLNDLQEVKTGNVKKTEDFECDLEDFFHDLSQLSLMGSKNSCVKKWEKERNGNVESRTNYNFECTSVTGMKNDNVLQDTPYYNSHGNDTSNNIIDISTVFEERKFKVGMCKPLCGLKPFSNALPVEHKSIEEDANTCNHEIKTISFDIEVSNSQTVLRSNPVENATKLSIDANKADIDQEIKCTIDNKATSKELEKCKDSRDESSCINYSADLFEMSGGTYEQSSLCVLTVSTPSFNTKSNLENASLNETLFVDSPMGTSTPGLDDCVVLDSQDLSCICDSQDEKDLEEDNIGKRRVTFDKRLRRVSTCHLMDIRMRLNESPLTTPVMAGKPCIKNKQKISVKNVPEISTVQKLRSKCENIKQDNSVGAKGIVENLGVFPEADSIVKQNSECLDGSSDLFGVSFILPSRSPLVSKYSTTYHPDSVDKETVMVQNVDVQNVNKNDKVKDKDITEGYLNSQDLWLNESTDSFIYDALSVDKHIKLREKSMNLETRDLHDSCIITGYNENIDLQKHNLEQAITPDLFASPYNNNRLPIKVRPDGNKVQYFSLQGNKMKNKGKIEKCSERLALKCLVINTPDCVSASVSKHKPLVLNCGNHSKENKEYRLILDDVENINAYISPDIFEDSIVEKDVKIVCDRKTADNEKSSLLCKKLFF